MKYFIPENKDKFLYRDEEDGILLYFKEDGNLILLNPTGAIIFRALIKKEYTLEELSDFLIENIKQKPDKETVLKDVREFIENLKKLGILMEKE